MNQMLSLGSKIKSGGIPFLVNVCLYMSFFLLLYVFVMFFLMQKWVLLQQMEERAYDLEGKIHSLKQENWELQEALSLKEDPEWQQLLLMRELGMVPFGAIYVKFREEE